MYYHGEETGKTRRGLFCILKHECLSSDRSESLQPTATLVVVPGAPRCLCMIFPSRSTYLETHQEQRSKGTQSLSDLTYCEAGEWKPSLKEEGTFYSSKQGGGGVGGFTEMCTAPRIRREMNRRDVTCSTQHPPPPTHRRLPGPQPRDRSVRVDGRRRWRRARDHPDHQ